MPTANNTAYIFLGGIDTVDGPVSGEMRLQGFAGIYEPDGTVVTQTTIEYTVPIGTKAAVHANVLSQVQTGLNSGAPLNAVWL